MNPVLRNRLIAAGAGGTIAIVAVLHDWYESSGKRPLRPYIDPVGIWTVCNGVTGPEVIPGRLYTTAECIALEEKHIAIAEKAARKLFPKFDTYNKWIQAALVDWLYNVGEPNATTATLRKKFILGDVDGGCRELVRWVKGRVKGQLVTLPGLVDRRETTEELCLNWGR